MRTDGYEPKTPRLAIAFLEESCADHLGRYVTDYLFMHDDELECDHEWVQWAFPIDTVSFHNPHAGLLYGVWLDGELHRKKPAYFNQELLVRKYLASIGVYWSISIDHEFEFEVDAEKFFNVAGSDAYSHHMKRISRLLRHLVLTGSQELAQEILHVITENFILVRAERFSAWTVAYWNSVVYNYTDRIIKPSFS
jgi:hypothetical protein